MSYNFLYRANEGNQPALLEEKRPKWGSKGLKERREGKKKVKKKNEKQKQVFREARSR